jgi:hypothetical protein
LIVVGYVFENSLNILGILLTHQSAALFMIA